MKRFLFICLFLFGCDPKKIPVIHTPDDTETCPDACAHLRKLRCEEASTVPNAWCENGSIPKKSGCSDGSAPGDLTCERFCEQTQKKGHALTPTCVVRIGRCADLEELDDFCPPGYSARLNRKPLR